MRLFCAPSLRGTRAARRRTNRPRWPTTDAGPRRREPHRRADGGSTGPSAVPVPHPPPSVGGPVQQGVERPGLDGRGRQDSSSGSTQLDASDAGNLSMQGHSTIRSPRRAASGQGRDPAPSSFELIALGTDPETLGRANPETRRAEFLGRQFAPAIVPAARQGTFSPASTPHRWPIRTCSSTGAARTPSAAAPTVRRPESSVLLS